MLRSNAPGGGNKVAIGEFLGNVRGTWHVAQNSNFAVKLQFKSNQAEISATKSGITKVCL